jgi:prepilin-type processing-associated H-X9-DG protein
MPYTVFQFVAVSDHPEYDWAVGFYGLSSYGGNGGKRSFPLAQFTRDGIFFLDSKIRLTDVSDGSSNTFLFGERSHRDLEFDRLTYPSLPYPIGGVGEWAGVFATQGGSLREHMLSTPVPINYQTPSSGGTNEINDRLCAFGSGHAGGANFAFADGSVRFLANETSVITLQALSTRAGGEAVEVP